MPRRSAVVTFLAVLALSPPEIAGGQVSLLTPATSVTGIQLECRLELPGGGTQPVNFDLPVDRTGKYRVQAVWVGGSAPLGLAVSRQSPAGTIARTNGASPLELEFDVPVDDVKRALPLRVTVLPGNSTGAVAGWVIADAGSALVTSPALDTQLRGRDVQSQRLRAAAATANSQGLGAAIPDPAPPRNLGAAIQLPSSPSASTPCRGPNDSPTGFAPDTVRTMLSDGRIETRYPDGTIKRQGIDSTCYEMTYPDGRQQALCPYSNVMRTNLADLPPELLSDSGLSVWLEDLGPHLLDAIGAIIEDPQGFQNYETFEAGKPLPVRIDLRLRLLNRLLENF